MTNDKIKELITAMGFAKQPQSKSVLSKKYSHHDDYVISLDFEKSTIDYGNKINRGDDTTSNFSNDENFVVLECIDRLLTKGYKPQDLTLEKKWKLGRSAKSGKADINVSGRNGKTVLIIECKTWGTEFEKEKDRMKENGGQLFSYFQQDKAARFLCLYTSQHTANLLQQEKFIDYITAIVKVEDTEEDIRRQDNQIEHTLIYQKATDVAELVKVWQHKNKKQFEERGIFEDDVEPYNPGYVPLRIKDLKEFTSEDAKKEYNEFEEILRHNNISDRSNAFNRFISLVLAKIKDEEKGDNAIAEFQVKEGIDDAESLIERLQTLYTMAMQGYLNENVINHTLQDIEKIISHFPRQTSKEDLKRIYRELKFYTNNEFSFKEIYNQQLFEQNAKVVFEIARRLQSLRFRYTSKAQFLGDFFEDMLESGFKQSEGQFFTPTPIAKFIVSSIPIKEIIEEKIRNKEPRILPSVVDYACGSGHFITESIEEIQYIIRTFDNKAHNDIPGYKESTRWAGEFICGVEKDYRLARTSQVACFMHGDGDAKIIYGDGLEDNTHRFPDAVKRGEKLLGFDILVANPPYSIKDFYKHLNFEKLPDYELLKEFEDKSGKEIEALFVERTKQLLKVGGFAGIFLPSTILNSTGIYTRAREIILKYFEIKSIVEFGSNTFSATSTNTIVLFMKRRSDDFARNCRYIAEDFILGIDFERHADFLDSQTLYRRYTALIGIYHDEYVALTKRNPSEKLMGTEFYKNYYKSWENLAETKRTKLQIEKLEQENKKLKNTDKKEANKIEQNIQKIDALEKSLVNDWFNSVLETECEKFEYFLLSHRQVDDKNEIYWEEQELEDGSIKKIKHNRKRFIPQHTLIIKSGKDNDMQKAFLGYTFSDRRGYKGLDMKKDASGKEITKLYDKENIRNPEKANTYIYKAFMELPLTEIDENLKEHITLVNLVDTFDFERIEFEKQINTLKAKKVDFQSKFELQTLGSLVDFQSGLWTGKKSPFKTVKVIRNTNFKLNNGMLDFTDVAEIKVEKKQFDDRTLEYGDIILEKSGGSDTQAIGRVVLFEEKSGEYSFSNFCSRIRIKDKSKLNPVFLWTVLHDFYRQGGTESLQNGIRLLNIDFDGYKNIKIPLPPRNIQVKIVKEIEKVEKNAENALTRFSQLTKEKEKIITDEIINGHYSKISIGSICETSSGGTPLSRNIHYYEGGTIPWINSGEVGQGKIYKAEKFITELGLKNSSAKIFPVDTVLVAMYGATAGKVGILKIEASTNQAVCAILPNKEKIIPEFLMYQLQGQYEALLAARIGVARENLSQDKIREFKISLPSIKEQEIFLDKLEKVQTNISEAQNIIEKAEQNKLEILKANLK